jgi:hypothetical protein
MKALPHILSAPKEGGRVELLCVRPEFSKRIFPTEITVTKEQGVIGDRWGKNNWARQPDGSSDPINQISILSKRVLDLIWHPSACEPHPGDTIITDMNLSLRNMPEGQLIEIGTALLRVSPYFNDGCVKWKARYGEDAKNWITALGHEPLRLRGILLSIERSGVIKFGDTLHRI